MRQANQSIQNKALAFGLALVITLGTPLRALADCDFKTGIEKLPDGRYAYSLECHHAVGKMKLDLMDKDDQIAQLGKSIELKDLAIKTHEQRAGLWMDTSLKLEDRVNVMESMKASNQWLYFGLGILVTGAAVWGAGQLRH